MEEGVAHNRLKMMFVLHISLSKRQEALTQIPAESQQTKFQRKLKRVVMVLYQTGANSRKHIIFNKKLKKVESILFRLENLCVLIFFLSKH